MEIKRKITSLLLLAAYSIVFAHNVIPHHHHIETFTSCEEVICVNELTGANDCCYPTAIPVDETDSVNHDYPFNSQTHCHFEVLPFPGKIFAVSALYLICCQEYLALPLNPIELSFFDFQPQKVYSSYSHSFPLRAPPIIG